MYTIGVCSVTLFKSSCIIRPVYILPCLNLSLHVIRSEDGPIVIPELHGPPLTLFSPPADHARASLSSSNITQTAEGPAHNPPDSTRAF